MAVLYLVPTPISENSMDSVLPVDVVSIIKSLKQFVVEDIRTARRFLKKLNHPIAIEDLQFRILNEHTSFSETASLLPYLLAENTGIMSEAGLPCLADPGAKLVRLAHANGITVVPLSGSSAIIMALIASGLNGQSFSFVGYLPVKRNERQARLSVLEKRSAVEQQTQIFIETPYRNIALMEDIVHCCRSETLITIAAGITGPDEYILTQTVQQWKKRLPDIKNVPAVFLLQA